MFKKHPFCNTFICNISAKSTIRLQFIPFRLLTQMPCCPIICMDYAFVINSSYPKA